jgi:osmoprotectant transport system substrate-binding protein/osmoprotectant transport system permease protein
VTEQLALLPRLLTAHLQLTLLALLVGVALSVPLGVLVTRVRWLEQPILGLAGVVQTIPGLALLAVMVPLLAALGLDSIGFLPAFIGLTLYGVLPILRNTVAGIAGVDPALVEAAEGVGMTPAQRLRLVELPLAMPVIVAGVRTATVWIVGMATLSTPVGAPSLGNYIFSGLQTRNFAAVLVGCVASAALALTLDGLVRALETGARDRRRGLVAVGLVALGGLGLWAGGSFAWERIGIGARPVVVGAKTFTEQYVLGEVLAQQVTRTTGLPATITSSLGSTVAFDALVAGDIDTYVDYSGTIWATILHHDTVPPDREEVLREVNRALERDYGVRVVAALGFENAYALAMRGAEAERRAIRTITDLVPWAPRMSIGGDYEFFARPEWRAIRATYGLRFAERRSMDSSLMYEAAANGAVDVISAFSTDARIDSFDLRVLADDRHAIPPYDAVVLVGRALARRHPDAVRALAALAGTIDAARMRRMNLAVDQGEKSPAAVAEEFLAARVPSAG